MSLSEIRSGTRLFIDSNIFIYHFTGASDECTELLYRCEHEELAGYTSTGVIAEVTHRLMMLEAVSKKLVRPPNLVKKLTKKPQIIKNLTEYFIQVQKIPDMGVSVVPLTWEMISLSHPLRLEYGLMVNDSLVLSCMKTEGIHAVASADKAFRRVRNIELFEPGDLEI